MLFRRSQKKSHFTDEELIRQYQLTREPVYVGELYQRYTHLVYGISLKYLKEEEDSKDAVMQIFEKLLQVLKTQEISKFANWLHILVRNYCLMELRRKKNHATSPLEGPMLETRFGETDGSAEEAGTLEHQLHLLETGLHLLPEEQRICLDLFYLQKKCYQEIVETTGYDLKKVKSYLQNGKRNLKIYLQKQHDRF